ncbi:uncharacterized protein LOC115246309 isoform X2 [Formica exsecta]|uniref:uncharacterized protein LOC115246309 isoform X2 n=1 Tax=Formica exsecta TaxID=72781 RepID=UPI001143AA0F|nr:uncharacterized protein LOC115246309 isoform X2 [Formica exsecta]
MYSDQREGEEGEENPLSRMSLQHHAEATAVTPDYPSVSDFERDFLGLSSHSQWSSMLHRTRHHRSRFCKILIALLQTPGRVSRRSRISERVRGRETAKSETRRQ